MKTTRSVIALRKFLSRQQPDLEELSAENQGREINEFMKDYRVRVLRHAYQHFSQPPNLVTPERIPSEFEGFKSYERNSITQVAKDGVTFTSLDAVVNVGSLPVLVEVRSMTAREAMRKYFKNAHRKLQVLFSLFGHEFGWMLILPSEYRSSHSTLLAQFKEKHGEVSLMPYSSRQLFEACYSTRK